ncbi:type IV pilin protein [Gayadomonas joobiniege]|uniref:type IV pilin protein n=1 Tax=Gayadomonas joobiniege TaxID=1234606 RepID=UPI0003636A6E|nr:type IV pilin protein [Gayadomonas joobiniege]
METQLKKVSGMTLIEILVTLAIIGIITAVAYPAYVEYYAQSYRADVLRDLARAVNKQESYYADQLTYTANMKDLGYGADPCKVETGAYTLDVKTDSSTDLESEFLLQATASSAQKQNDPSCAVISINHLGEKFAEDTQGNDTTQTCWY